MDRRTRRDAKNRPKAAVLAGLMMGTLAMSGCGPAQADNTLTWYINPDAGGQAAIAQKCSDESGGSYRIETSLLPSDAASQREQLARRLAAGDSSLDIMSLDPPFIPELAEPGFLAPVPEDVQQSTTENVVEGALAGATWKDELVTVPFWANTQILWYRKSVAEAAGLDMSKPVTWEQIMEAAKSQEKTLGVQGASAESMTVWVNALIESAGGSIIVDPEATADTIELGLDSDAGTAAAEVISTIGKEGLGGPGLPTQDENASLIGFQGDSGSFMVNYPFVWPATSGAVEAGTVDKKVLDDIGWGIFPRMTEDQESAPPLGGINLGVGAESSNPELAYEAIQCIVSVENQAEYFVTNGNPPSNTEAYEDPRIEESFPMAETIRDSLQVAAPRPQTPFYNEVSTGIQQTWAPPAAVDPESTPGSSSDFITSVLRGEQLL
ncbi:extracellular solute-binding protein [Arthrobacter sp. IIF3SC--B10]|uniref:Extracellular solute-binding protein n=1 Tax=Arthrobacter burdickii TaxID=3035920 RepID=A0ABT8JYN8_9MICC|nr:extracellular solute-binding protein [Arthrobacter burdickii]MDN4610281.1 extracellular solute-binding protein [Arthrobacter burdickii]